MGIAKCCDKKNPYFWTKSKNTTFTSQKKSNIKTLAGDGN